MINQSNIFCQKATEYSSQENCYLNNLYYQEDPIGMFLNQEAFVQKQQQNKQIQTSNELSYVHSSGDQRNSSQIEETQHDGRKKSIFHNFQKHLITLIKKFVTFSSNDEKNQSYGDLSIQIWNAFMKTRSFNKKILHMVFGVMENKLGEEFTKLSTDFPQFKRIGNQNTIESIVEAQKQIREQFIRQCMMLNKVTFQNSCHVNRFDEFYQYYQSFICQLRIGPMTKRMTKSRKYGVVERLKVSQNVL